MHVSQGERGGGGGREGGMGPVLKVTEEWSLYKHYCECPQLP